MVFADFWITGASSGIMVGKKSLYNTVPSQKPIIGVYGLNARISTIIQRIITAILFLFK